MLLIDYYHKLLESDTAFVLDVEFKSQVKQRPRMARGRTYTPKPTKDFERKMADAASTVQRKAFTCPVVATVNFFEPVPKSYSKLKAEAAYLGLLSPPVGDVDNKAKAVLDGLNGVAFIDDKQVLRLVTSKAYGPRHRIYVSINRGGLSLEELAKYGKG